MNAENSFIPSNTPHCANPLPTHVVKDVERIVKGLQVSLEQAVQGSSPSKRQMFRTWKMLGPSRWRRRAAVPVEFVEIILGCVLSRDVSVPLPFVGDNR